MEMKESVVPRYYFDLINGRNIEDKEGENLPSLEAAREHATEMARELARRRPYYLREWTILVTAEDRQPLFEVPLSSASTD
jgi:hypothetical protein